VDVSYNTSWFSDVDKAINSIDEKTCFLDDHINLLYGLIEELQERLVRLEGKDGTEANNITQQSLTQTL
jgi:hypothetical protein